MTRELQNLGLKIFTLSKKSEKSVIQRLFFKGTNCSSTREFQRCQYKNDIFKNIYVSDKTLNYNGGFLIK